MPVRAFAAPYDSTSKAVSVVVCLSLLAVAWLVHVIYIALLFPLLIGLAYAYSPRGYLLSADSLIIKRLIGNITVPLSAIRQIRPGTPGDFTGCIRLWGNGGLFGYYGLFRTTQLGKCYWYVTDRARTVIISTEARVMVLSPDDVQGFIETAGVTTGSPAPDDVPRFDLGSNLGGKLLGIGFAVAVLGLVSLAMLYSPGPPGYTLTPSELTIHDKFYPVTLRADAVDAAGIRIVDLPNDPQWRPTARTNGFANRNYQSGWFRVSSGATVRLYRAGGNRLVLIPPHGPSAPVLYQARDPERFALELRRQWAGR